MPNGGNVTVEVGVNRVARKCLERHLADKTECAFRGQSGYFMASLSKCSNQVRSFVGGDSTGNSKQNAQVKLLIWGHYKLALVNFMQSNAKWLVVNR